MYATDKTITDKLPDWVKIGVRVRVPFEKNRTAVVYGAHPQINGEVFVRYDDDKTFTYEHHKAIEPIARWIPENGETVATWNDGDYYAIPRPFSFARTAEDKYGAQHRFMHIARIPDNWKDEGYPLSVEWWANQEQYEGD